MLARMGIVLGEGGGALARLVVPFRMGVGGPLGSGRQWVPWTHRDDAVGLLRLAVVNPEAQGPMNVTSPNPVTMRELATALGRTLHRPAILPVPAFALRLALGEFADTLLGGQKTVPTLAKQLGYRWRFPDIEGALRAILAA